jgi:hypothetical protein
LGISILSMWRTFKVFHGHIMALSAITWSAFRDYYASDRFIGVAVDSLSGCRFYDTDGIG